MVMLVKEFDKEVAWHGVCSRREDKSDEYVIEDIVVYPQEVTGATVEMDTEQYAKWIEDNIEDERFNHIHMQGHSHVNMGTTPSSVDLNHQEEILNMLGDDDFYIFMIWNKSFSSTNKIYDLRENILFEDKDITVKIIGGVEDLDEFLKNAKDMVKTKTYVYTPGTQYGGYNRPVTPAAAPYNPLPAAQAKQTTTTTTKKEKPKTKIGAGWSGKDTYEQESLLGKDGDDLYGDDYMSGWYGR
jgi:hypothetical protein